jgi:hypothetical protein
MDMSEIKDGGWAFPSHGSMGEVTWEGMTLRDYFAGKALQGLLAGLLADGSNISEVSEDTVMECAYRYADKMLIARDA